MQVPGAQGGAQDEPGATRAEPSEKTAAGDGHTLKLSRFLWQRQTHSGQVRRVLGRQRSEGTPGQRFDAVQEYRHQGAHRVD